MKLNFGRKLVLFLHWLVSLFACALALALCVWQDCVNGLIDSLRATLGASGVNALGIVLLVIYAALTVSTVVILFSNQKKGERGFITVDSSEAGRTRIAVGAVEQMIRQAVRGVEGIVDMKSGIANSDDAVSINVSLTLASGVHVPTVTMNIQRAIRSYIELNCGVAVREVCVSVHAVESEEEGGKRGRRRSAPVSAPVWHPPVETQAAEEKPAEEEIHLTLDAPEAEAVETEDAPEAEDAPELDGENE